MMGENTAPQVFYNSSSSLYSNSTDIDTAAQDALLREQVRAFCFLSSASLVPIFLFCNFHLGLLYFFCFL